MEETPRQLRSNPSRPVLQVIVVALLVLFAGGCADPFREHRQNLEALHAQGRFDQAAAIMDSPLGRDLYGEKNQLLYWLDRGTIALAMDQPGIAIDNLERAEDFMEVRREPSAADEIGKWLINDTAAPYYGEPYEEQYVNVFKLLAQLEQGNVEGGATVEARRMAGKADVLRDRFLRATHAVEAAAQREGAATPPPLGPAFANPEGEFVESPLGDFLTAVAFLKSGDSDLQSVAARRLLTAIKTQRGLIGPVRPEPFEQLESLRPSEVNTLIVALSGRGPTKTAVQFGPIPIYTYTVYFELPELRGGSAEVDRVRLVVDGGAVPTQELSLVEDLGSVAMENHRRQLPLIYARAFLRSSIKAASVAIGTEVARKGARNHRNTQTAIEIAGILGGLLFVSQTEKADLRCWAFLPARAHVGLLNLPPGEHTIEVQYLSSNGAKLYSSPPRRVTPGASPRDLSTIVEQYWR